MDFYDPVVLGTAGASGLLAILFPAHFGTVDQFCGEGACRASGTARASFDCAMKPESLKVSDGVILIRIMRQKAVELNRVFSTSKWTPRKLDMVLWTCSRSSQP